VEAPEPAELGEAGRAAAAAAGGAVEEGRVVQEAAVAHGAFRVHRLRIARLEVDDEEGGAVCGQKGAAAHLEGPGPAGQGAYGPGRLSVIARDEERVRAGARVHVDQREVSGRTACWPAGNNRSGRGAGGGRGRDLNVGDGRGGASAQDRLVVAATAGRAKPDHDRKTYQQEEPAHHGSNHTRECSKRPVRVRSHAMD